MTAFIQGMLNDMTLKWNCPYCDSPGELKLFRIYNSMRIYVICAACDMPAMVTL